jgi:hypothetical protein
MTVRSGKERDPGRRIFDLCVLWVIVRINQSLLDQEPTHAVSQERYWPRLGAIPFYSGRFEEFARFADECILLLPVPV